MRIRSVQRFTAPVLAALVLSCGSDPAAPGGGGGGGPVQTTSVNVVDNSFNPDDISVASGATVTWTWQGNLQHNVTFDDAAIGNSTTKSTGTFDRTFNTPGTYAYECTIHGLAMRGSVVVQ